MIDPETAILFTEAPLPGVEVGDGASAGGFEMEEDGTGVMTGESEGAVGGAGGEEAGAIAGGEVMVEGEGAKPDGARDEDGGVATAGGGADLGEETGGDLVGEEAGAAPGAWPREAAIKAKRTTKTKAEDEAMVVKKNGKSRERKMEERREKFELKRLKMREEEGSAIAYTYI